MKFVISFLFVSLKLSAAPINILHVKNLKEAEIYRQILVEDYRIPEELILITATQDCDQVKESGHLDLCLKNNGDLRLVSVDREFINESLKVFQSP
jgi:hypothetical protein